ncbi:MAG: phytanoyl-CoA dioxygenase family protein [Caulobacteraceae bacterium]|nr:phytanoyl-CoA dioxygenase family protein [Caulobacteraceae bacterium]
MAVWLPDAPDISPMDIRPAGRLRDSSGIVDDRERLDERYEEDGYLYFRNLLPKEAVEAARREMMAPLLADGLIDADCVWIGGERETGITETGPTYRGVWPRLFDGSGVKDALAKLLGEAPATVPMVQYRAYPPNKRAGGVHQDGFASPGVTGYKPLWIPLIEMDEAMGGLVLATGFTKRDYIHNIAKKPMSPVPAGIIPDSAWLRADYEPTDLVMIHPKTPHTGLPNRSRRVRLSIDTRVQSAANPAAIWGELVDGSPDAVTLKLADGGLRTLRLSDQSFIRSGPDRGPRLSRTEYLEVTPLGELLMAAFEGDHALMLRRADPG